ncbi:NACHT domain-containing protein [Streptomyces sp. A0592]|uniref:NACHT domain-containing protein n=1 Tax=Streptomyces sp. A0592 TaxID=2563099 RepID=UPI00109E38C4|nr:NACHT domain-containing protein [Streptomyces sp. A0592]THA78777.1 NACHT domain-containing protein [Streptomyces sp. A0592]
MTGFETVLLRVAGTAASALVRSALSRTPGAGLTTDPARPVQRWRKPPAELGGPEIRRLTETLATRLTEATAHLPEHERLAAVAAVGDAFAALGPLDAEALFAADLDPDTLATTLPPPPPGLGEAAEALYGRLVRLCCEHALEYLTTLPAFGARADVELVRRTGNLARAVDRLGAAGNGTAYAFEERYAQYIAATHGRLQLFGLTLSRSRQDWPLDVAYISLAVSGAEQLLPGEPAVHRTQVRAEQALASVDRILLRGPAGSGKSTLVQWLALNAARQAERPWAMYVPFVLRLRSFTASGDLPLPEDFLRAGAVPLSAPPGWVEDLMLSGRALVLVDGVDEVPQRLRARTETWLRSLVSAFPKARYVVTTRPSAVPEDWLAGLGFATHSMLPMEQRDIRAFVEHWHAAARAQGQEVDAYEASLLEAVSSRRDLARLATNPLMCALLCALNQDRRMQLPRARKEVYDAALDMLLVRRDTEREISGVEGVYLTREEQIALLQRLAYWLIRNGQLEAGRDEAVEMVDEWLNSMPQVAAQGGAEQVFTHLLIRSGLLLEPVPGSVVFVHRTFQDYLGAKAAVESRDFGVLVRNAHDDSWDDVVRMAVGHARPDERTRILRGLLKRADKVKGARNRLVLLAAACLEHAPELDPAMCSEVKVRVAELLPPRSPQQAEELSKAGALVLDLLPRPGDDLSEPQTAATIRTASLVGGEPALEVIRRFREEVWPEALSELDQAWGRFDAAAYASAVLSGITDESALLSLHTPEQLACLELLPNFRRLRLVKADRIPPEVARRTDLQMLYALDSPELTDVGPLSSLRELEHLALTACPAVRDIHAVAGSHLQSLFLSGSPNVRLDVLRELPSLSTLGLSSTDGYRSVGELPTLNELTGLWLFEGTEDTSLDGLGRWTGLRSLSIVGDRQGAELRTMAQVPDLQFLQMIHRRRPEPEEFLRFPGLTSMFLSDCDFPSQVSRHIAGLTRLRTLSLSACGTVDLSPLAELPDLTIHVYDGSDVRGGEALPPGRLRFH